MCDRYRDELPLFVAGVLSADLRERIAAHLDGCASCRAAVAEWSALQASARAEADAAAAELPPLAPVLEAIEALEPPLPSQAPESLRSTQQPASARSSHASPPSGSPSASNLSRPGRWSPRVRSRRVALGVVALGLLLLLATAVLTSPADRGRWIGRWSGQDGDDGRTAVGQSDRLANAPTGVPRIGVAIRAETSVRATAALAGARAPGSSAPSAATAASAGSSAGSDGAHSSGRPREGSGSGATPVPSSSRSGDPLETPVADTPVPPAPEGTPVVPRSTAGPPASPTPPGIAPTRAPSPNVPVPSPLPAAGAITGRVLGSDGVGRAEVRVSAHSWDRREAPAVVAYTDATGAFSVTVGAGAWLVAAEGAAFRTQWHARQIDPALASPVVVGAGALVDGIDFQLDNPPGILAGRVTRADGSPVEWAMVAALRLDNPADPADPGHLVAVAFTGDDGTYRLALDAGIHAVAVHPTWWAAPAVWWDGHASLPDSDLVVVEDARATEDVDFVLP